ncbi:sodium/nucleoside cotransporter 2-like [Cylas formicarius]|uniref:sodium/nucleoside cotransporter 2-like n=1 Tax=Cylas formicarius TaxID=197179 RepID=UPI002958A986|nr:sodium/nucleoside cotransporter 2-like [Cylas formicarius]XP_060533730.1 sodium/nucleoside cotransporter 2-like [Cylas formicarius]
MENGSTDNFVKTEENNIGSTNVVRGRKNAVINFVIFLLITGYCAWATWYYVTKTESRSWDKFTQTTSDGYGFLVILYCIYVYALAYYYCIKPFILPPLEKLILMPGKQSLKRIKYGSVIFYLSVLAATVAYLVVDTADDRQRLIPLIGLTLFLLFGFIISSNHSMIPWDTIIWGMILQFLFGLLTIRWEIGRNILETFSDKVNAFLDYGLQGAFFTYGELVTQNIFAFSALSVIFFLGFVINLLYYYGLMQKFVSILGGFLQIILGTSVCESVNSVAVVFVGMSEAPMMLRPYLKNLTDSELHSMMLAGFASVSGSTLAAYISFGARPQDLITASIMSAPSALCFSKLMYPETEEIKIQKDNIHLVDVEHRSAMEAASKGATDAFHLIAAIISGITACLSFVYFINGVLSWCGAQVGFTDDDSKWTLDIIAGKIFTPVSWVMGIPWDECEKVGQLIGVKTMVNEFVAFQQMGNMTLTLRSKVIATYAICGFSNPGSIGIAISTMSALVPERKEAVAKLVFRAFVGGALVCLMTACIAGILMPQSVLEGGADLTNVTMTDLRI